MNSTSTPRSQKPRTSMLSRWTWIVVLLQAIVVVTVVAQASPVSAQTHTSPGSHLANVELGSELYPPTDFPTNANLGIVEIGRYDIGCANDGFMGDVGCLTVGVATNVIFSIGKMLVAVAIWLLEASTGFAIEGPLSDAATTIADLLDARVLGPMRLAHLGLVVSALYMGWQFLRGRIGAGLGEFAVTLIVFGVLFYVTTGPGFGSAVTTVIQGASGISSEIVSLAGDTEPGGNVADHVSGALIAGFVRDPYDTINWGQPLEGTQCALARNEALQSGPHGVDDAPRDLMVTAGCQAQADFNAEASVGRLIGATLYLVVAIAALGLFIITAFTLVVAKGLALFLIALFPIALYAGLFPGAGRSLLWHWVAALVRVVALIVVMGIFLALLITGLHALLSVPGGLWTRFLLVIFFMAVMAVGRRQLLDISAKVADSTLQRLESSRIGGAHGATWIRPYQAGGVTGLGVTHTIRGTNPDIPTGSHRWPGTSRKMASSVWRRRQRTSL